MGEYYTGVGDVQFAYDTVTGVFVEGQRINGSAGVYGYLVSINKVVFIMSCINCFKFSLLLI
jgi:hypothetical protein